MQAMKKKVNSTSSSICNLKRIIMKIAAPSVVSFKLTTTITIKLKIFPIDGQSIQNQKQLTNNTRTDAYTVSIQVR